MGALQTGVESDAYLTDAEDAFIAALEVFTWQGDPVDWAEAQNGLGRTYQTQGVKAQSIQALQKSVSVFRAAFEGFAGVSPLLKADAETELAKSYQLLGLQGNNMEYLQKAQSLFQNVAGHAAENGWPLDINRIESNLSWIGTALSQGSVNGLESPDVLDSVLNGIGNSFSTVADSGIWDHAANSITNALTYDEDAAPTPPQ
jgi:tetratricopeptide (TPR) repeat protein